MPFCKRKLLQYEDTRCHGSLCILLLPFCFFYYVVTWAREAFDQTQVLWCLDLLATRTVRQSLFFTKYSVLGTSYPIYLLHSFKYDSKVILLFPFRDENAKALEIKIL